MTRTSSGARRLVAGAVLLALPVYLALAIVGILGPSSLSRMVLEAGFLLVSIAAGAWILGRSPARARRLARRLQAAESLIDVCGAMSRSLEGTQAAQVIVEGVPALLGARGAVVYLLDRHSGALHPLAVSRDLAPPSGQGPIHPKGTGAVGLAVTEGRLVTTPDVLADPRIDLSASARGWVDHTSSRAVLAVPLIAEGEVLGALGIGDRPGRVFDDEDIRLAGLFADQAALVLRNARLYDDARRREREAEIVAEVSRSLNASLDLDTVLELMVRGARELCRSDLAWIAIRDTESDMTRTLYGSGARHPGRRMRIDPGKGVGGRVLLTGQPFRTDHYAADPRVTKDYLAQAEAEGVVASMAVPIRIEDRIEGLLYVENRAPRPFTDEDETVLVRLAGHAGVAMRNARLYGESERRRRAAESLAEVGQLISRSLEPAVVHQRIAESLRSLLGATLSRVYRLDPDSGALLAEASSGPAWPSGQALVVPRGMGVVGLSVAVGGPIVTGNLLEDPRIRLTPEMRASGEGVPYLANMAVPLVAQDRVIGALTVGDQTGRRFEPEEVQLAQAFASQAAVAFQNAQLHAEAERRRGIAERLAVVGRLVSESLEPAVVAGRIVESLRSLAGARAAVLCRVDGESEHLVAVATAGDWPDGAAEGVAFPRGTGASGLAATEQCAVVSPDILADPRIRVTPALTAAIERAGHRAVVAVPLIARGRVVGTLEVGDAAGRKFGAEEIEIVETFAGEATGALERARLFTELQSALALLTSLSRQLLEVQEDERQHLARELHDEIGQLLTGLKLSLEAVARQCPDSVREPLGQAQTLAVELIGRVREIAVDLRPPMLDDLGLFPALVWQLARFTRQTGVEVDFVHSGLEGRRLPAAIALVAYRIVQEALTNVARHSGAGSAAVRLSAVNGLLHGEVEDKGVGYEPERLLSPTSIGLAGMRERAELVGGRIRGESLAGVGTRLTFELPLPDGESLGGP